MADYDIKSDQKMLIHITPASLDADANGVTVDTLGFKGVNFGIYVGIGGISFSGSNKVEYIVQHSDDDSTWTAAPDDALILDVGATAPGDTGIVRTLNAAKAAADTTMTTVGYRGHKRYARVRAEFSGTHGTATPMAVVAQLGRPMVRPVGAVET